MSDDLTSADDNDDAEFRARLAPLAREVLPGGTASRAPRLDADGGTPVARCLAAVGQRCASSGRERHRGP